MCDTDPIIRGAAIDIVLYAEEAERVWPLLADTKSHGYDYAIGPKSTATVIIDKLMANPDREMHDEVRAAIAEACIRVWSGVPVAESEIKYIGPTNRTIAKIALHLADVVGREFGK